MTVLLNAKVYFYTEVFSELMVSRHVELQFLLLLEIADVGLISTYFSDE